MRDHRIEGSKVLLAAIMTEKIGSPHGYTETK